MNISKKERLELGALSKEVFGTTSRWQKIVNRGYEEVVMEEKFEDVPADENGEGGGVKTIKAPKEATKNGGVLSTTKYHTVESIRTFMLEQKTQLDEIRAKIAKAQEENRARKAEEARLAQILAENAGSATE